jgi:Cu-Zn family superoxide dismutase
MANHVWTGCTIMLSIVGLAVGVAEKQKARKTAKNIPIPKEGVAVLHATKGHQVRGTIRFEQTRQGVRIRGRVQGLKPGKHGFHIHEFGDLRSADGKSAGEHFNPMGVRHGGPADRSRHAGDLGNITANSQGEAQVDKLAKGLELHFVIGRSIVVHAGEDDLKSQPSGNAGDRVALGVIGFAGPTKTQKRSTATSN